ncbi:hypothetical protein CYMTET_26129, partial [Cymbomonas tetramitiformis]
MQRTAQSMQRPRPNVVHSLVQASVQRGALTAIYSPHESVTFSYSEIWFHANTISTELNKSELRPESLVAICVPEGWALPVLELGVLLSGLAFVPVSLENPLKRVNLIINDSGARVAFVRGHKAESYLRDAVGACSALRILCIENLLSKPRPGFEDKQFPPARSVQPHHLCHLIYTSGSTGAPKGVLVAHQSVVAYAEAWAEAMIMTPTSRVLVISAFTFDPSLGEFFTAWSVGACVCLGLAGHSSLGDLLRSCSASHLCTTPAVLSLLPDSPEAFPSLRSIAVGGDVMDMGLVHRWGRSARIRLVNVYGVTEATVYQTFRVCQPSDGQGKEAAMRLIGAPLGGVEMSVRGPPPGMEECALGEAGEICIAGAQLARGYLNQPELTSDRFVLVGNKGSTSTRWYRTGDLGVYAPDGAVEGVEGGRSAAIRILGRADNQ